MPSNQLCMWSCCPNTGIWISVWWLKVVSELREPRKIFPRATAIGITTVVLVYMALNILYVSLSLTSLQDLISMNGWQAAIIPKDLLFQKGGIDVGTEFFARTLGNVIIDKGQRKTVFAVLKAISAFGNLIVITFTTARGISNLFYVQYNSWQTLSKARNC